jgi:citrate lyase gamma subunit
MANLGTSFQDEKIKLYTLDLSNAMNKQFYNKDKDTVVKSANNTNFKSTTLVVFKKGKVSEVLTDKEKIVELLNKEDK